MPPKKSGKEFQWTDDEAELLLTVTNEYKVSKVAEGVDWESVKIKYSDIMELMQQELPSSVEEAGNLLKDKVNQFHSRRVFFAQKRTAYATNVPGLPSHYVRTVVHIP